MMTFEVAPYRALAGSVSEVYTDDILEPRQLREGLVRIVG